MLLLINIHFLNESLCFHRNGLQVTHFTGMIFYAIDCFAAVGNSLLGCASSVSKKFLVE